MMANSFNEFIQRHYDEKDAELRSSFSAMARANMVRDEALKQIQVGQELRNTYIKNAETNYGLSQADAEKAYQPVDVHKGIIPDYQAADTNVKSAAQLQAAQAEFEAQHGKAPKAQNLIALKAESDTAELQGQIDLVNSNIDTVIAGATFSDDGKGGVTTIGQKLKGVKSLDELNQIKAKIESVNDEAGIGIKLTGLGAFNGENYGEGAFNEYDKTVKEQKITSNIEKIKLANKIYAKWEGKAIKDKALWEKGLSENQKIISMVEQFKRAGVEGGNLILMDNAGNQNTYPARLTKDKKALEFLIGGTWKAQPSDYSLLGSPAEVKEDEGKTNRDRVFDSNQYASTAGKETRYPAGTTWTKDKNGNITVISNTIHPKVTYIAGTEVRVAPTSGMVYVSTPKAVHNKMVEMNKVQTTEGSPTEQKTKKQILNADSTGVWTP